MSRIKIRAALETALLGLSPAISTSVENKAFTKPGPTLPFQRVTVDFAEPRNTEFGPVYQERGFMQVALAYPAGIGSADIEARVEMIRARFPRGAILVADDQAVTIYLTPNVLPGFADDEGRYVVAVRIPFFAQITN